MISSTPLKKKTPKKYSCLLLGKESGNENIHVIISNYHSIEKYFHCQLKNTPDGWKKKALLISIEKYPRQLQNTHVIWKIILCSIENTHNIWKRNKHWHLVKKTPLVSRKLLLASEIEKIDRQMPANHMIWPAAGV